MVRDDLTVILGKELRFLAMKTRGHLNLTQREMGERLQMSESNYSDIETGEINCCGTLTAVLLLGMQEDPTGFINTVNEKLQSRYDGEVLTV